MFWLIEKCKLLITRIPKNQRLPEYNVMFYINSFQNKELNDRFFFTFAFVYSVYSFITMLLSRETLFCLINVYHKILKWIHKLIINGKKKIHLSGSFFLFLTNILCAYVYTEYLTNILINVLTFVLFDNFNFIYI